MEYSYDIITMILAFIEKASGATLESIKFFIRVFGTKKITHQLHIILNLAQIRQC